ncbi:16S rRNA (cytosine(1402)-N(4))-methyltransferase RsmH [Candidatus Peregrinibacteria bacterium]|nr:16S rRNA (cytosine(1402)-N(4))-methyltransferase RsmH [Candidatus Peregrinibacteria bacterium]
MRIFPGQVIVDATVGLGGHSEHFLKILGKKGSLIAIDADQENLSLARKRLEHFQDRIQFFHSNFENLAEKIEEAGFEFVDGIFFDLGLSSPQVDEGKRGFSFLRDGPLDMRFDKTSPVTAHYLVNRFSEKDLIHIFRTYGEEPRARFVARAIVEERKTHSIDTTKALTEIIERSLRISGKYFESGAVFYSGGAGMYSKKRGFSIRKRHPATRIFQALRIAVNRELEVLEYGLNGAISKLKKGGRIAVISYHSLEDRIVKHTFRNLSRDCICSPEILQCQCGGNQAKLHILTKKPLKPDQQEIQKNPRSRSALLRVAEKL